MGKQNGNKKAMTMRGLMCHSPSATAVCVPDVVRSAIVPRPATSAKYSRLLEPSSDPPVRPVVFSSSVARTRLPAPPEATKAKQQLVPLTTADVFQVVVLRVSLHCQGCAGKVKRHLSKMEGVTSFSIDLETKRVTVMGHIAPNAVLESISKVKRAEFWAC